MRLPELTVLYLLIGIGSAAGLLMVRRPLSPAVVVDAALLGTFWPLYGPFLLLRGDATARRPTAALDAGGAGAELPLESLLPDQETAEALERRLALARSRVAEIDHLLAQPDFSLEAARQREQELEARGDARAAATARQRVQAIRRLGRLRERFGAELTEIRELVTQFRIQAEVVRLAGEDGTDGSRELLNELHLRLETLDEMLGEESPELASAASAP